MIGIPLASLFTFYYDMGVVGLQLGLTISMVLQFLFYSLILSKTNMKQIVKIALKRIAQEQARKEKVELPEKANPDSER